MAPGFAWLAVVDLRAVFPVTFAVAGCVALVFGIFAAIDEGSQGLEGIEVGFTSGSRADRGIFVAFLESEAGIIFEASGGVEDEFGLFFGEINDHGVGGLGR